MLSFERYGYNRYIAFTRSPWQIKTAFCFSVPIYDLETKNPIDMKFIHSKNGSFYSGSNVKISVTDRVRLQNQYGGCDLLNLNSVIKRTENAIFFISDSQVIEVTPTLNGIMLKFDYDSKHPPKLRLTLDRAFHSTRENDKCFAVMYQKFIPFVTVSCIGTINDKGYVIDPCKISNQKIADLEYSLEFICKNKDTRCIMVEINLYETKLFQDTTVESNHPNTNNVFGGTAFLGISNQYGEQWLYSRLDLSNLPQIQDKRILKAILHIPQLGKESSTLSVFRIAERFCSFETNWQNKIAIAAPITESSVSNRYYHLDITELFSNFEEPLNNFVIRAKNGTNKPVIIPTGDNFYTPQILEVQFQ